MLNPYVIAESVATRPDYDGGYSMVEAHEFHTDNIHECGAEMAYELMSEAVSMNECFAVTEEIMSEAAFHNPAAMDALVEASFQTVKENVKKFFDKIISFVMGIINKIKAVFAKTTGNVNKWLEVMKPRVMATMKNTPDWKSLSAEMWTFNINYIINGMPDGVKSLADSWRGIVGAQKGDAIAGLIKQGGDIQKFVNKQNAGDPAKMGDKHSKAVAALNSQAESAKNDLKKYESEFPGVVAKAMGCKANTSLDAIWSECGVKAHNGKTQKVTVTYGGQVEEMLKALEMATDTIKNLSALYEAHLKDLKSYRQTLDDAKFEITGGDNIPGPVVAACAAAYLYLIQN